MLFYTNKTLFSLSIFIRVNVYFHVVLRYHLNPYLLRILFSNIGSVVLLLLVVAVVVAMLDQLYFLV